MAEVRPPFQLSSLISSRHLEVLIVNPPLSRLEYTCNMQKYYSSDNPRRTSRKFPESLTLWKPEISYPIPAAPKNILLQFEIRLQASVFPGALRRWKSQISYPIPAAQKIFSCNLRYVCKRISSWRAQTRELAGNTPDIPSPDRLE